MKRVIAYNTVTHNILSSMQKYGTQNIHFIYYWRLLTRYFTPELFTQQYYTIVLHTENNSATKFYKVVKNTSSPM